MQPKFWLRPPSVQFKNVCEPYLQVPTQGEPGVNKFSKNLAATSKF
jgi:hypothetical protein